MCNVLLTKNKKKNQRSNEKYSAIDGLREKIRVIIDLNANMRRIFIRCTLKFDNKIDFSVPNTTKIDSFYNQSAVNCFYSLPHETFYNCTFFFSFKKIHRKHDGNVFQRKKKEKKFKKL